MTLEGCSNWTDDIHVILTKMHLREAEAERSQMTCSQLFVCLPKIGTVFSLLGSTLKLFSLNHLALWESLAYVIYLPVCFC